MRPFRLPFVHMFTFVPFRSVVLGAAANCLRRRMRRFTSLREFEGCDGIQDNILASESEAPA